MDTTGRRAPVDEVRRVRDDIDRRVEALLVELDQRDEDSLATG